MHEQELQEHLTRMRAGEPPLPLTRGQAIAQASRLRRAGMSYGAIATAMLVYHGHTGSSEAWRHTCRSNGCPPMHYADGSRRLVIRGDDA